MSAWLITLLDLSGIAVFAATGALAASRKQLDVIGFAFLAALTGIGGGTMRDLLLGVTPVFWIADSTPVILCGGIAILVYLFGSSLESRYRTLLWADAVGMASYAVVGASKALGVGASPVAAIVMGMMTGTFGGILRDVVSGEKSVILRREIYVTAALLGSTFFVTLAALGVARPIAIATGVASAFCLRAGALIFGWSLPVYRSRPPADAG